jgi:hypothetical protein
MSARESRLLTGNILREHPGFQEVVAADDAQFASLVEDHLKAQAIKDKAASRIAAISILALPLRREVEARFPNAPIMEDSPHPAAAREVLARLLPGNKPFWEVQEESVDLGPLITFIKDGRPAGAPNRTDLERRARGLVWVEQRGLLKVTPRANSSTMSARIVVPEPMQLPLLTAIHAWQDGHSGVTSLVATARETYAFVGPSMRAVAERVVNFCPCQMAKHRHGIVPKPLHMSRPTRLFSQLGLDLLPIGPHRNVVIFIDMFSKDIFMHYVAGDATADDICMAFDTKVYPVSLCAPDQITTDSGLQMTADLTQNFIRDLATTYTIAPPNHQQSNGAVEQAIGTAKQLIRASGALIEEDPERALAKVLALYRGRVHSTTGFSPYELSTGTPPPVREYGIPQQESLLTEAARREQQAVVQERAAERIAANADATELASAVSDSIPVGAIVYRLKSPDKQLFASGTFASPYEGPFMVALTLSDVSYSIVDLRVPLGRRNQAYAIATRDQLRRADVISNYHLVNTVPTDVLTHRVHPEGRTMFLVAWPADDHLSCFGWLSFPEAHALIPRLLHHYCNMENVAMPEAALALRAKKTVSWGPDVVDKQEADEREDFAAQRNADDTSMWAPSSEPDEDEEIYPQPPTMQASSNAPISRSIPAPEEITTTTKLELLSTTQACLIDSYQFLKTTMMTPTKSKPSSIIRNCLMEPWNLRFDGKDMTLVSIFGYLTTSSCIHRQHFIPTTCKSSISNPPFTI